MKKEKIDKLDTLTEAVQAKISTLPSWAPSGTLERMQEKIEMLQRSVAVLAAMLEAHGIVTVNDLDDFLPGVDFLKV